MNPDLPFIAEYAKSGRSSCKICKQPIVKESLRMGILVQSPKFDGKVPLWHHMKCYFLKKKLKSTADVANFDNLRWEDQKMIKDNIGSSDGANKNGKPSASKSSEHGDFNIEYAKSSRSLCKECGEKILKGDVRISKLDHDSPEAHRFGPIPGWRHVDCFVKARNDLEFTDSGDKLPGYSSLSDEDKEMIKEKLKSSGIKRKSSIPEAVPKKMSKKETQEENLLKIQSKLIYDMRDKISENMPKKDMIKLLELNDQHISRGVSNLLDNVTDCLIFGGLKMCPECKSAKPRFKLGDYKCSGNVSEWTKCEFVTKAPERQAFEVPEEFREAYSFLKNYKYTPRERLYPSTTDVSTASDAKGLPLSQLTFLTMGKFKVPKNIIVKKVTELGGTVVNSISHKLSLIISTDAEVKKETAKVLKAKELDIHIVSSTFLDDIKSGTAVAAAVHQNLLSTWGSDPLVKFLKSESKSQKCKVPDIDPSKQQSNKVKVVLKGGAVVDPASGLEEKAHVYRRKDELFNVVLGKVDISKGTNTYYKLQILESMKGCRYWLFRSWGRVGTTIGGDKIENLSSASSAIKLFKELYLEKTGNQWEDRKNFVKQPGLLYPLDIDYGQDETIKNEKLKPGDNSSLPKAVQELICFIFDIDAMKEALIEFEIDLKKMPLGKLSKKQIEKAYSVLTEVQEILVTGSNAVKILDASNRFYTLIPHDFGLRKPTLLDNEDLVKSKLEMLDSLLEIEFAYNLIQKDKGDTKDPVDTHYEQLKTDIEVVDKKTKEYQTIKTYLSNTHAKTHNMYNLKLHQVFKINRHGESERYKAFEKLENKKLLWHGSRFTNFVGILSQGLRIAPPEAPVTGYMFGKGIYFADMVSKSANYCFATQKNNRGLLLLCEVALGNMYERRTSDYITKLPKGKHSTLGVGMTVPDPQTKEFLNEVEVPLGKPVTNTENSVLLYNEYIVYDVNQVNIKYLLEVDFKWK